MLKKIVFIVIALVLVAVGMTFSNKYSHLRNFAFFEVHTINNYKTHPISFLMNYENELVFFVSVFNTDNLFLF